ncbi:MAG: hypothetical protein ACLQBB_09140 [Solirubrobacteraceae bacterium]
MTATGETSGEITVHSDAAKPWDPSIYDQEIPDNGYTYLTTRDGTQLAIHVHPPSSPAGECQRRCPPARACATSPAGPTRQS